MIHVTDIAHVRYQAPDLEEMAGFLRDFGLYSVARTDNTLYARGSGSAHHLHITERGPAATLGFGFYAASRADLDVLAAHLGVQVEANEEPGGGDVVRFTDPSGFRIDVIHGRAEHVPLPARRSISSNHADRRGRQGEVVRLQPSTSYVARLGHVAVLTSRFAETLAFYQEVLGFKITDSYWAGHPDNTIAAFLHCGLGDQWTDHHTIAWITAQDGRTRFDHSAFEVLDLDDLMQGNALLKARGHAHAWGVGRHIQGSQIFDYWRDPFGNKIEHWTDGDLVNDSMPPQAAPMSPNELFQWGPALTPAFFD